MVEINQIVRILSLNRNGISSAIKNNHFTTKKIQNLKQLEW